MVHLTVNSPDKISNCFVLFDSMSKVESLVDSIRVSSSCPNTLEISSSFKVRNYVLDGPLRDAHL